MLSTCIHEFECVDIRSRLKLRDKNDTLESMSKNLCINYVWYVRNIYSFRRFTSGNL